MTSPAYYDESYPPEILRGYVPPAEPPIVEGAARRTASSTSSLTVTAGEPGTYEPEVAPADRPRNVTELRERARVSDPAPWAEGEYVLVGTSGKRAHWSGEDWHGGESPGYPDEPADDDLDAEPDVDELDAAAEEAAAEADARGDAE